MPASCRSIRVCYCDRGDSERAFRSRNPKLTLDASAATPYLARYMTGGPISSRRIVSHENGQVTFLDRSGTQAGGAQDQVPVTMDGVEFMRRGSLHIQSPGFVKTTRFGGSSIYHCQRYHTESRDLLPIPTEPPPVPSQLETKTTTDPVSDRIEDPHVPKRPACGERTPAFTQESRPSWREIMPSRDRPEWYAYG